MIGIKIPGSLASKFAEAQHSDIGCRKSIVVSELVLTPFCNSPCFFEMLPSLLHVAISEAAASLLAAWLRWRPLHAAENLMRFLE